MQRCHEEQSAHSKGARLSPLELPSARKRLQMKIFWGFVFAFVFVMERQRNSHGFSFAFALLMIMLGTYKPQQQVTLTKQIKIREIFFRFRFCNSTQRKSKIPAFVFFSLVIVSVRMVDEGAKSLMSTETLRESEVSQLVSPRTPKQPKCLQKNKQDQN